MNQMTLGGWVPCYWSIKESLNFLAWLLWEIFHVLGYLKLPFIPEVCVYIKVESPKVQCQKNSKGGRWRGRIKQWRYKYGGGIAGCLFLPLPLHWLDQLVQEESEVWLHVYVFACVYVYMCEIIWMALCAYMCSTSTRVCMFLYVFMCMHVFVCWRNKMEVLN